MTEVLDGATLRPDAVARIARHGARVELAEEARARNQAAARAVQFEMADMGQEDHYRLIGGFTNTNAIKSCQTQCTQTDNDCGNYHQDP